ncbi:hypothetical protein STEG23_025762, partial [Scotinomys teguina]
GIEPNDIERYQEITVVNYCYIVAVVVVGGGGGGVYGQVDGCSKPMFNAICFFCPDGTKKSTCSTMFIAALFVIARTWKQPRCPSTEEWIRNMWFIYTMEYYAAEKNNDIMKFAGKWMELENIILSEVTQTQKDKHDPEVALSYCTALAFLLPDDDELNIWNCEQAHN